MSDFDTTKYRLGSVCKRGHTYAHYKHWNLRYKKGGDCFLCLREQAHARHLANPELFRQRAKDWRLANPERHKEMHRNYRSNNPEKVRRYIINWKLANPERKREINRKYRLANPERIKKLGVGKNHRRRARKIGAKIGIIDTQAIKEYFNNQCCYCGSKEALELDHIQPLAKGGSHTQNNLAIACLSCNRAKWSYNLFKWYNNSKSFYTVERFVKITKWMFEDG